MCDFLCYAKVFAAVVGNHSEVSRTCSPSAHRVMLMFVPVTEIMSGLYEDILYPLFIFLISHFMHRKCTCEGMCALVQNHKNPSYTKA